MSRLPDTTRDKTGDGRRTGPVLAAACLAVLLLAAALFLGREDFSPGEELFSPRVKDIAASTEDTTYPKTDALRFGDSPRVVYVYLRVEDLPPDGGLEARVGRAGGKSALSLLSGGGDLRVVEGQEEQLGETGGGVSGVIKFAVRAESGRALPAGNYTVGVYAADGGAGSRGALAKKYFVVGYQQG